MLRYTALLSTGVLFARGSWTLSTIGIWEALMLVTGFTGFFWVSGLLTTLIPSYRTQDKNGRAALLAGSWQKMNLWSLLLTLGLLVAKAPLCEFLGIQPGNTYYLFCAFVFFQNPGFLAEYTLLLRDKSSALIRYGALVFSIQILLTGVPALLGASIFWVMTGLLCFALIKWLYSFYLIGANAFGLKAGEAHQLHLKAAIPLMGSLFLGGASVYIDGFIVSSRLDEAALAVFQYGAREFPLVLLLANAFSTAVAGDIAEDKNRGLALIHLRSEKMFRMLLPVVCALLLLSPWLYPAVFGSEFESSWPIFNIYLLLILPRLLFPQTILTGLGKTGVLLRVSAFELILNLVLSLWWIELWGIQGVAWATVVAYSADKLLLAGYNFSALGISPLRYINLTRYPLYSVILAGCYLLSKMLH